MPQLKPAGKITVMVLVLGAAAGAYRLFGSKLIPEKVGVAA